MITRTHKAFVAIAALALFASACGSTATDTASAPADAPTAVVTTNILGDVVRNIVGDQMNVETIMPVGADPHDFQASAQQVASMEGAVVLISNGAAFEEGLLDVIEAAEADGVPSHEAIEGVRTIEFGEDIHGHDDEEGEEHDEHEDEDEHGHDDEEGEEHDEHEDEDEHGHDDEEGEEHDEHEDEDEHGHDDEEGEEHDDHEEGEEHEEHEEHEDEHGHAHDGADPHFFTDPARMATAAEGIADFLIETVDGVDAEAIRANADAYIGELEALDAEVAEMVAGLSEDQRVLVTNHEVFGYFADNYGFEVVGTVIPSGSTADGTSAAALVELVEEIEEEGVPAIFADTSSSDELAQTLADEVGDIAVVELFSESLGDADSDGATYIDMVRSNATNIVDALAS